MMEFKKCGGRISSRREHQRRERSPIKHRSIKYYAHTCKARNWSCKTMADYRRQNAQRFPNLRMRRFLPSKKLWPLSVRMGHRVDVTS